MISDFKNKTAVLTGAGSGFGLECARIGAKLGMNLVLVDVQQDALDKASEEMKAAGAQVLSFKLGAEEYGIDILRVQEIRGYEAPTTIANAPEPEASRAEVRRALHAVVDGMLRGRG